MCGEDCLPSAAENGRFIFHVLVYNCIIKYNNLNLNQQ